MDGRPLETPDAFVIPIMPDMRPIPPPPPPEREPEPEPEPEPCPQPEPQQTGGEIEIWYVYAVHYLQADDKFSLVKQQVVWPPGSADTVCPRPRAKPYFIGLYTGPWQLIACSIGVSILKFVGLHVP